MSFLATQRSCRAIIVSLGSLSRETNLSLTELNEEERQILIIEMLCVSQFNTF
jgi:hypothetical protein